MSERDGTTKGSALNEQGGDPWDARLRALLATAHPWVDPPDKLRRRVAERVAQHEAQAAVQGAPLRRGGLWRWPLSIGWLPAAGAMGAALLLAGLGFALVRMGHGQSPGPHPLATAKTPPSERPSRTSRTAPRVPPYDRGRRIAARDMAPQPAPAEASPSVPSPTSHHVKSGRESSQPDRVHPGPRPQSPSGDDLAYVNQDPEDGIQQWVLMRPNEREEIEARVRRVVRVRDDFVTLPFPRLASSFNRQVARAVESYKREAAIVDPRLSHEVTCAFKATALADLCSQFRSDTGIQLSAGPSVADEKATVFCEKLPLRDVMRQLSRPFGYTWLRSGTPGAYKYELVQDLRSQLLEEELRNRDRNAALLDIDREMNQYRRYQSLSPDEALARAASASPEEKKLLEYLAGKGWGPAQLYYRLSPGDLAALRVGQTLTFRPAPGPGEQPLPPELARAVIVSLRDYRIVRRGDRYDVAPVKHLPDGLPPASVSEAQPVVTLHIDRSELGQLTLCGFSGFSIGTPPNATQLMGDDDRSLAVGMSPAVRSPQNAVANARFAGDPSFRPRISLRPESHVPQATAGQSPQSKIQNPKSKIDPVTSADVLEALHRATGLPIVADYYTRLYPAAQVSVQNMPLIEALNRLGDTMRLRWSKDTSTGDARGWLQFRSADFYNDRLKEVPNRLLFRWAASRREHGALTLDDLIEIAQLTDAQLDSSTMAEGARVLFGLEEWRLASPSVLRPNWRFLASLSPEQRRMSQSDSGLPFTRMSLAQQQEFLARLPSQIDPFKSLEDLNEAALQVDYTVPGAFEWSPPKADAPPLWHLQQRPPVRERTRQAALLAAQRIDPQATEAQIAPTDFTVTLIYRLGGPKARLTPFMIRADLHNLIASLPQPVTP